MLSLRGNSFFNGGHSKTDSFHFCCNYVPTHKPNITAEKQVLPFIFQDRVNMQRTSNSYSFRALARGMMFNSRVGTNGSKMKFKIACSVVCKVLENLSSIDSFNAEVSLSFILNILPSRTVPRDIRIQNRKAKSPGRLRSNVWSRPAPLNEVLQNFHLFIEKFHSSANFLPGIIRYLIFTFL